MRYWPILLLLPLSGCKPPYVDPAELQARKTPVMEAVHKQDLVALSKLIDSHAQLDEPVFPNQYPIEVAVRSGQLDVVEMLLQAGVSPNTVRNEHGPLETATEGNDLEMVKLLLSRGANPRRSGAGPSAISIAAQQGNVEIAKALLGAGADIDDEDSHGYTPLIEAIRNGDLAFVKFLVSHGANPNRPFSRGLPIQAAKDKRFSPNPEVAKYLEGVAKPVPANYQGSFNHETYLKELPERRSTTVH